MKIIKLDIAKEDNRINDPSFIALGNFDGMHLAHVELIKRCVAGAKENNEHSSVLLFEEHSMIVLADNRFKILSTLNQKIEKLKKLGVNIVYLISFNDIKNLSPQDFIEELLIKHINSKAIYVGYDYTFGRQAKGNTNMLEVICAKNQIKLDIMDEMNLNGVHISSTNIRKLIEENQLSFAEELLGHEYWLEGKVVEGKKMGSKLGFPTANIALNGNYVLPDEGVYYTLLEIDGQIYAAATSLGKNLTFDENDIKIEAHIINFNRNIYGKALSIRFVKKIRDMVKFNDLSKLTKQVLEDCETVETLDNTANRRT